MIHDSGTNEFVFGAVRTTRRDLAAKQKPSDSSLKRLTEIHPENAARTSPQNESSFQSRRNKEKCANVQQGESGCPPRCHHWHVWGNTCGCWTSAQATRGQNLHCAWLSIALYIPKDYYTARPAEHLLIAFATLITGQEWESAKCSWSSFGGSVSLQLQDSFFF